jgi:phospholipid/cholesterol/gamma-HCH transport system substrate-binding protein
MESEARYAVVGAFVFIVSAAAIIFVIWFGQVSFDREYSEYQVVFKGPVRGLSQSGEVRFNGIKVGEVVDLGLAPEDPNTVLARIRIFAETPVKEDSYAQLEPQGITGLSYIQIYGGELDSQQLRRKPGKDYPQIPSKQAQLEGLVAGGEDVILAANTALIRINSVLSTQNINEFSQILANIRTLTGQLASEESLAGNIDEMVRNIASAAKSLETTAADISKFANTGTELLEGDTAEMIAGIDEAADELRAASEEANLLIQAISDPVTQFSHEGLGELTQALTDLRAVLQAVERVVEEVDRDPVEFIAGEPLTEMEVPR